jgi:hypothetical protein
VSNLGIGSDPGISPGPSYAAADLSVLVIALSPSGFRPGFLRTTSGNEPFRCCNELNFFAFIRNSIEVASEHTNLHHPLNPRYRFLSGHGGHEVEQCGSV